MVIAAGELRGVYVNDGKRFRIVEHERHSAAEFHSAVEELVHFVQDIERVENIVLTVVQPHFIVELDVMLFHNLYERVDGVAVVADYRFDIRRKHIADVSENQIAVAVDLRYAVGCIIRGDYLLPLLGKALDFFDDFGFFSVHRSGTGDKAAALGLELGEHGGEPFAGFDVGYLVRHADEVQRGQKYDISAGYSDRGRESRALGAEFLFRGLHHYVIAFFHVEKFRHNARATQHRLVP